MAHFPQLRSGAAGQYPMVKMRRTRTARNTGSDGHTYKLADPAAEEITWELRYKGLSDAEWQAIASLFEECEGRLGTFVFPDPTANLLCNSEDCEAEQWRADPLITVAGGVADPAGGSNAQRLSNNSQASQSIGQTIAAPASLWYCFSLYARGSQAMTISLEIACASAAESKECSVTPAWRRLQVAANLGAAEPETEFRIHLPAGATVEVYGIQAEAQPSASAYKKTATRSGVYAAARFADDSLTVVTEGPDCHSTVVRIVGGREE